MKASESYKITLEYIGRNNYLQYSDVIGKIKETAKKVLCSMDHYSDLSDSTQKKLIEDGFVLNQIDGEFFIISWSQK